MTAFASIDHKTADSHYTVTLGVDQSKLSLEGLDNYWIRLARKRLDATTQPVVPEILRATLKINVREEMNWVSIENGPPFYFTITRRSLELSDDDIESSIHEVVDLGLMEHRIEHGLKPLKSGGSPSLLFDPVMASLVKSSVSSLLAQATVCHRQVIDNAGHLFASRQDYVRDMCNCMITNADTLAHWIINKTRHCYDDLP